MSATAIQPDPLALFQARCAHRRRARSLNRSLRALVNAEFDRLPNLGDFHAFLDRHHIPRRSARRLLAPAPGSSPQDFDAIFRDQTLTVRLRPNHRAILQLCADVLQSRPAPLAFGAIAVAWLRSNTAGLARQEIDAFLRRFSPANSPDWCLHLPPVLVPSSVSAPRKPPRSAFYPPASEIPALWPDLRDARRAQRLASRQLKPLLPDLALLLARKHVELALAGRSGAFLPWLRANGIPRRTAYRLLKRKDLNCAKHESNPTADLELFSNHARFRLSPIDSAITHRILLDALQRPQPRDFSALIAAAFINQLPDGPALSTAFAWFDHPGADLPLPRLFHPNPRYFNRGAP
ncbi:MAG: hypothetical protein ACRD04_14495 [Terriglobales bacterium]